jgi:hypothetical protein
MLHRQQQQQQQQWAAVWLCHSTCEVSCHVKKGQWMKHAAADPSAPFPPLALLCCALQRVLRQELCAGHGHCEATCGHCLRPWMAQHAPGRLQVEACGRQLLGRS